MCLYTTQNGPAVAAKDITCYKVIRKDMTSLYYNDFKWEFGKMYTSWIEVVDDIKGCNFTVIYQALHSYKTLKDLKKAYYTAVVPCLTVKCTIPSGSRVYKGKHDSIEGYASNQLIVNEVIDTKELYPDFDWDNYPYKEGQIIQIKMTYNGIWENYQITNIQPHPINNTPVKLIVKNCSVPNFEHTIMTTFNGKVWQSENCFILSKNKDE